MRRCLVTVHASERAVERFGVPQSAARRFVDRHCQGSIKLPYRLAQSLMRRARPARKGCPVFRVSGDVMLVCRGRRVVTVWRLTTEELATVLTWLSTGRWIR